jgi:hypothetical protein
VPDPRAHIGSVRVPEAIARCLCVPRTSSKSCDQAIFVDQAIDASVSSDAVLVEVDRLGQPFQRRGTVQRAVWPVLRFGMSWRSSAPESGSAGCRRSGEMLEAAVGRLTVVARHSR